MKSLKTQDRNLPWSGIIGNLVGQPGLIKDSFTRMDIQDRIVCTFLDNLFGGRPPVGMRRRHRGFFEAFEK